MVIPAYSLDRWDLLRDCIASVLRQSRPADEVIIAVDHCDPLARAADAAWPELTIVRSSWPRGLSGGRNTGLEASKGSVVAFIDDDAVADEDWLAELLAPLEDPTVLAVGGTAHGRWVGGRPEWFPAEFDWVVGCSHRGLPTSPSPVRNVIGCNMAFRRYVFGIIGGFRHEMSVGPPVPRCDETELCIRLGKASHPGAIILAPSAVVTQEVPLERAGGRYFLRRCWSEGMSKATVAHLVGARSALATEASYTRDVLPAAVARGIAEAGRGDWGGAGRSAAVVAGLGMAAGGYLWGGLANGRRSVRVVEGASQRR